jgi:predicted dehydrogenase|tara:strand:- start:5148 stop:6017 length:870 start_codon:yes stop_codon:yes gene_type:complete
MEDIKILLVGCGYWGKNWYNTIKKSEHALVGVVDPDPVIKVDVPLYDKIEEVDIEYTHVILAVNASLHVELAAKAKVSDKSKILVEKPCGTTINDSKELKGTFPGYLFLYSDEYQYIKNNLDKIGTPKYWKSTRASMGPRVRSDVSIVEDYMIHDLYMYYDLFYEPGKLVRVWNKHLSTEFEEPIKESSAHITLSLNNIPGQFYSSWCWPDKERKIVIHGDKGSFVWVNDDLYFDDTHYDHDKLIQGSRNQIETSPLSNLELQLKFFILGKPTQTNCVDIWQLLTKIGQ